MSQGTSPYIDNSFAVITNPPTSTFSTADAAQTGSPISGLVVGGVDIDPAATARQASYVPLDDPAIGSSTANNGLDSTFSFVLGQGGALDFSFDARAYLEAFTSPSETFPTSSSAEYGLIFTLDDLGGLTGEDKLINWEPDRFLQCWRR